jgi:hypothetical protein
MDAKTEATIGAGQEQMRAQIKIGLEEINATEAEANHEKTEAVVEHNEGGPHAEGMDLLTVLQDQVAEGLHLYPT